MTTYFDTREFEELARGTVDLDPLAMGSVTRWCKRECARRGVPFETVDEPRRNAAGEQIGPRMEISHDAATLVLSVAEAMATARNQALERILDERFGGIG